MFRFVKLPLLLNGRNVHEGKWFRFIFIFIFISAIIETDIYLPSFPDILHAFNTNAVMVQRILSFNFIGVCIGSLVYGPLSDHFGRRPILMFGFALFTLTTIGCVIATSIEQLLFFRLLQGFGSAACMVVGTAIIFDLFEEEKAAKFVGDLSTMVVSMLAFAPLIGGWINIYWGYRGSFIFVAVLVFLSAVTCLLFLPESLPSVQRRKFTLAEMREGYAAVLSSRVFWYNTLISSLMLAAYFAFISNMSLLFVNELNVAKSVFPYFQMAISGSFVLVSINNGRLIDKWGVNCLKNVGLVIVMLASLLFLASPYSWLNSPYYLTLVMCVFTIGVGCSINIFIAQSMRVRSDLVGIASSLVTAIRLCIIALSINVSSSYYDGSSDSMMRFVVGTTGLLFLIYLFHYISIKGNKKSS
ncbi:multidrug effflux MFS transporter [uncultured Shewanella sp.]|uniref:multidrug effflux MFS transporter n=1 Tax=uncultured Shewanella sp. TaxID=173975 RepID=UPI00260FBE59|nr:multidrug effflux MFS transporter [uncultured Shewanella sp.]